MASTSVPTKSARHKFLEFLEDSDYKGQHDLYDLLSKVPDLHGTVQMNADALEELLQYMQVHILRFSIEIPPYDGTWVPCDLLTYIHKGDEAFAKRLKRFQVIAEEAGHLLDETVPLIRKLNRKRKMGAKYLSFIAATIFFVNEEPEPIPHEIPHLLTGGFVEDKKEPPQEPLNLLLEREAIEKTYPLGVDDKLKEVPKPSTSSEPEATIPEVEIETFSVVLVEGQEYLFLHDVEKAFGLRLDECLSLFCTLSECPLDSTSELLEKKCLPFGDSMADPIKLVCNDILTSEHEHITEEQFSNAQERILESKVPASPVIEQSGMSHSSINLQLQERGEEEDRVQDEVIEVDKFAARSGGDRVARGGGSSLANYIGKLPKDHFVIIHKEFSPQGHFMTWCLKALSKLLCLSTITQGSNCIFLVKKSLVTTTLGSNFRGKVLGQIGISLGLGVRNVDEIANSILTYTLPMALERRKRVIEKLKAN